MVVVVIVAVVVILALLFLWRELSFYCPPALPLPENVVVTSTPRPVRARTDTRLIVVRAMAKCHC